MAGYADVKLSRDNINIIYDMLGPLEKVVAGKYTKKQLEYDRPIHFCADSRGSELRIMFRDKDSTVGMITVDMEDRDTELVFYPKKSQYEFETDVVLGLQMYGCNAYLGFVENDDKLKWREGGWNSAKSPDPGEEYEDFKDKILRNVNRSTKFDYSIAKMLMDSAYFNGVDDELRSTILYRTDQNPFQRAADAINENPDIIDYTSYACNHAYRLRRGDGNGNPRESRVRLQNWGYVGKGLCCKDSDGHKLWFSPKWADDCPFEYKET